MTKRPYIMNVRRCLATGVYGTNPVKDARLDSHMKKNP
jgi:hypothetical protein